MKPAFLFPGQGSQVVGMGRELADRFPTARAVFDEADEALGFALSRLIFDGPDDELKLTEHTQPAILTVSVAAARVLQEQLAGTGIAPSYVAGHSLGEYSAHVVAGSISFADAVRTVRNRGRYMQEAVPAGEGAMAAVLGLPPDTINDICGQVSDEMQDQMARATDASPDDPGEAAEACREAPMAGSATAQSVLDDPSQAPGSMAQASRSVAATVTPANLNAPEQTVISGSKEAVERAAERLKEAGAKRVVMLAVSAPFHCSLMRPAQERLSTDLEAVAFADTTIPVVVNVDARCVTRGMDARDCLIRQVTGPVRWVECMRLLIRDGATSFVEIGPGKVLSGLMRQIDRSQTALNVEDVASLEKTVAALRSASQGL